MYFNLIVTDLCNISLTINQEEDYEIFKFKEDIFGKYYIIFLNNISKEVNIKIIFIKMIKRNFHYILISRT